MWRKFTILGSLFLAGALAALGAAAHAAAINTSGVVCQNLGPGSQAGGIYYVINGAGNFSPDPRQVVCAVPRSPLAAGTIPTFFIDGSNSVTATTCTLFVYTPGMLPQSRTFTEGSGVGGAFRVWRHVVQFPPNSIGVSDYASLVCTLPGNFHGVILGVTSVQ